MNDVMRTEKGADNYSRSTNPTITDSEQQNAEASQSRQEDNLVTEVPIYLFLGDKGILQPLNIPARNAIVHKSPALLNTAVAKALQRQANKEGLYENTDCVVNWKRSAIPFHIEFEISASDHTCQHLASVRNIKAKDTHLYAKNIFPLAKVFLSTPPGSHLPHLPFTRSRIPLDSYSSYNAHDKQTTETIEHASFINNQHNSLTEIDVETAEATARMINAGKIFSDLLVYLTSPKPRISDITTSTKSPTTKDKRPRPTARPFPAAPKRPKPLSSAHERQALEPVLGHKRVISNPRHDIDGVMVTEEPNLGDNSASGNTSAVEKSLPEEPAAAMRSSKRGKASKKKNQDKKRRLNKRTKNEAVSTISAYPTQRPPRRKPATKLIGTRDSSENNRVGDCELARVPATRLPLLEDAHEDEQTLKQSLILNDPSENDCVSSESNWKELGKSKVHTLEELPDANRTATDVEVSLSDIVQGEDLTTIANEPIPFSPSVELIQTYGSGIRGLLWAYAINTKVEETLADAGIWLWRKPKTHFRTQPSLRTEKFGHDILAPVLISQERTADNEPIVEFDGDTVRIVPHEQYWEDVRSYEVHPDFLIPWKLAEYQASEAAGYQVWRHDRDLLVCRKPGCDITVSDYHHSAVVCLGCGPKSFIRYCSLQHQFEDIEGHWKECGTWKVVLERVIDHTTAPSRFSRMWPAIKQRHGPRTAALHRQMLYCALTYGHYTLFDSGLNRSETLCWPKQDPKWPEKDRRVERLLNIAFLDGWNHHILGYLFRLLRETLRSRGEWSESTERSLKLQFEAEFSDYGVNTKWHNGDAPCQCEWSGRIQPRYDHLSTCREFMPVANDRGPTRRQNCIEATVRDYEDRFWILRAWRQQHPTQNNWRLRAAGYGFPDMVPDESCYELGPGWTGWGGEEDNIRKDQGDQEGKRSVLSV